MNKLEEKVARLSEILSEELKKRRFELNASKTEIATSSLISRPTLTEIEAGNSSPSINTLMKLSHALKLSLPKLIESVYKDYESDPNCNLLSEEQEPYGIKSKPAVDDQLEEALLKIRKKSQKSDYFKDSVISLSRL